jgi:uncharacterized membrane protein YfcA
VARLVDAMNPKTGAFILGGIVGTAVGAFLGSQLPKERYQLLPTGQVGLVWRLDKVTGLTQVMRPDGTAIATGGQPQPSE